MPLQIPHTQQDGIVLSYHIVSSFSAYYESQIANCVVGSYLDSQHLPPAYSYATTATYDLTQLFLSNPNPTLTQIEQWLIANAPDFSGATQV